ncbi:hypothetical protein [Rhizomicrobium electricum]|uniref:Uncharacterized protein n=1 Tax=Rhizomicrobium electricum TaxID=480070 RepID=A0ABN1EH35_9PROT|nr:hypothetical protein [Rhizomicrobium electricum]NIJ48460.1 hypothetical protein [Rhizomicrobium electricum]
MPRMIAIAGLGLLLTATAAAAQTSPVGGGGAGSGPGGVVAPGTQMGRGNISAEDFNKLQDYVDVSKRLSGDNKGKTVEDLMKEDKAAATALVAAMPFACQVDKAVLAAEGPATVDGKTVQTKTYETVCTNGLGYFLTSRESLPTTALSCLAADAANAADKAAGRKPGPACLQPEVADVKTIATNLMTRIGTPCTARDYRWVGNNSSAHVEFGEVACTDNTGYIVTYALPGSTAPARALSCRESNARGLPCKLSDNGGEALTPQTFRKELKQRAIACDAADNDVRLHGQETNLKRFVVEFKCSQHPQGLVAYLPLNGVKAPFEVVDCAGAAKRGVTCALNPKRP